MRSEPEASATEPLENPSLTLPARLDRSRDVPVALYGAERGKAVKCAEVFEICEYGRRPGDKELKTLFPFFEGK